MYPSRWVAAQKRLSEEVLPLHHTWPQAPPGEETDAHRCPSPNMPALAKGLCSSPLQYPLPMNSIVRGFRAVQKPPLLHFIKHLLKMELDSIRVEGHQREKPLTNNVPTRGSLEGQVVTRSPSKLLLLTLNSLKYLGTYRPLCSYSV